jgi:hypothetical protein
MRARAAQVQPAHRRAVVAVAEHRPRGEQLVGRQRAVEDVAPDPMGLFCGSVALGAMPP